MRQLCLAILFIVGCTANDLGPTTSSGGRPPPTLSLTCQPCVQSSDCAGGACAQYGGSDYCGNDCSGNADCQPGETCTLLTATDASEVQICIPTSAACGGAGCASCPSSCNIVTGTCDGKGDNGGSTTTGGGGGTTTGGCPGYADPSQSGCCQSCSAGTGSCQANGCYGGWFCDTSTCKCHAPPATCGSGGTTGGGGGTPPVYTGSIGANGGSVSSLYFAVVGDTRPANVDGTSSYPTAIIDKIYSDIAALNPQPQFVITTGDYMFASTSGGQASPQIALYQKAASQFTTGPIFAAMGNHECTGATASNCAASPTSNMNAFMDALVKPLGKSAPYYTIPISDSNGVWTAKIIIAACNAWDATQSAWLKGELAKPTTYTFVVRHEPTGTSGPPCVTEMDSMMSSAKYDLFITGHSHTFSHSGKQLIIGNGGAPLSGSGSYGFATIAQQASGFLVTEYDYLNSTQIATFTVQ